MIKLWIISFYVVAVANGQCPKGWMNYTSSCYKLRYDTETWLDAKKVCELEDAYLAEIGDDAENNFAHGLLKDNLDVWLGGTDLSTEGEWIWVDSKSDMTYTKWRPTEPNNLKHGENCMEMDRNGLWNDRPCHYIQKYICEKEMPEQEIIG